MRACSFTYNVRERSKFHAITIQYLVSKKSCRCRLWFSNEFSYIDQILTIINQSRTVALSPRSKMKITVKKVTVKTWEKSSVLWFSKNLSNSFHGLCMSTGFFYVLDISSFWVSYAIEESCGSSIQCVRSKFKIFRVVVIWILKCGYCNTSHSRPRENPQKCRLEVSFCCTVLFCTDLWMPGVWM